MARLRIVEDDSRDDEVNGFIRDAAAWVEDYTGQILEAREVTEQFRAAPRCVDLLAWPIEADAEPVVTYVAPNGAGTVTGVRLDLSRRPARVMSPYGWPSYDPHQIFTVTIRAGYENPAEVPPAFRRAMLILISAYDEDREGGDTFAKAEAAAKRICRPHKRHQL